MLEFYIKKFRDEKGWSQEELAVKSGVSASHIGYIENGEREPTITVLEKLAKALNKKVEELYKITD